MPHFLVLGLVSLLIISLSAGCAHNRPPQPPPPPNAPLVSEDNDSYPIPEPAADEEGNYVYWDVMDAMGFDPLENVLDTGDDFMRAGHHLGIADLEEAANVNALDEVPDSTWFTNRHGKKSMSIEELKRGPNLTDGPDMDGPLEVVAGKGIGVSPGFVVLDRKGDKYLIKFDPREFPEMNTATEVVASKILYAAGYNVPEYHLVFIRPGQLLVGPGAKLQGKYRQKRAMTEEDVREILVNVAKSPDGTCRAVATKFIPGKIKGPTPSVGVRKDDPNDSVNHEDRRDLRGMKIILSFLNHTDVKRANSLDAYIGENGEGFVKHYILDFAAAMGSGTKEHKPARVGHEYLWDPSMIMKSLVTLGLWVKPWEEVKPAQFDTVGPFSSEAYDPDKWKTLYSYPIFRHVTDRDAFWAAKIITAFSNEDLRAIVETGEWTHPGAVDFVTSVLGKRRDVVGRTYFGTDRINPLDNFVVSVENKLTTLTWQDLGVARGYAEASAARYRYSLSSLPVGDKGKLRVGSWKETRVPEVYFAGESFPSLKSTKDAVKVVTVETSHDDGKSWSPPLFLYLEEAGVDKPMKIVGLRRET